MNNINLDHTDESTRKFLSSRGGDYVEIKIFAHITNDHNNSDKFLILISAGAQPFIISAKDIDWRIDLMEVDNLAPFIVQWNMELDDLLSMYNSSHIPW